MQSITISDDNLTIVEKDSLYGTQHTVDSRYFNEYDIRVLKSLQSNENNQNKETKTCSN